MPNNLDEKIALLLNDIKYMSDQDARAKMKNFVLEELAFLEGEHIIEESELALVKSNASRSWTESNLASLGIDQSYQSTWFLLDGMVSLLRNRGLIPFKLKLKKNRRS